MLRGGQLEYRMPEFLGDGRYVDAKPDTLFSQCSSSSGAWMAIFSGTKLVDRCVA